MESIKWLEQFEDHPSFSFLQDALITDEKLVIEGNKGAFLQVIMATLQKNKARKQLIIANDQEEAAYFLMTYKIF